ncbi:MAG TPA: riboflavin synthase [Candidatus Acidoferrum sp.]|nr:riboflavin synthase [Candidatus Acidoferrum sp.]
MFTGIIEHLGTIESLDLHPEGGRVTIHAPALGPSLAVANSIAVNGCCLTITSIHNGRLSADLSGETIAKTSFGTSGGALRVGSRVNLERPLTAGKEFGGHFVLGHVDTVGCVTHLTQEGENWWYAVRVPEDFARYIVPKGSISIDGISLTVARWRNNVAEAAIIPYTYDHTNIRGRNPGDAVNLEADILGKYIERYSESRNEARPSSLTMEALIREGF